MMKSIPTWAKVLAAVLVCAVLIGAAQIILWFDHMASNGGLN